MLDGGAHFGCDGLLLNEEEVGFDDLGLLGFLVLRDERCVDFIGVGVFSFEGSGGGSLDDGKCCYDIAIGVGDLVVEVSLAGRSLLRVMLDHLPWRSRPSRGQQ